jgi:hypothetical protein
MGSLEYQNDHIVGVLPTFAEMFPLNKTLGLNIFKVLVRNGYPPWIALREHNDTLNGFKACRSFSFGAMKRDSCKFGNNLMVDFKKLHTQVTEETKLMLWDIRDHNPRTRQCDLSRAMGCPKYKDNNELVFTYCNMLLERGIIETFKEGSKRLYTSVPGKSIDDIIMLPFVEPTNTSSICEACTASTLLEKKAEFKPQMTFPGLKDIRLLRYDFGIWVYSSSDPDSRTLILCEVDGKQHVVYTEFFHRTLEAFEKQVKHDRMKTEFALLNGITLIRIPAHRITDTGRYLCDRLAEMGLTFHPEDHKVSRKVTTAPIVIKPVTRSDKIDLTPVIDLKQLKLSVGRASGCYKKDDMKLWCDFYGIRYTDKTKRGELSSALYTYLSK